MIPEESPVEEKQLTGYINSTESFGSVDGPGVRFIFFMQGCPLRCKYCHNPEMWAGINRSQQAKKNESPQSADEITSQLMLKLTPQEALNMALRYKNYWKGGGGITVSGGEAMCQMEFVTELFRLAKALGINTALDTSGIVFKDDKVFLEKFDRLKEVTDLFILDIKEMDTEKHIKLTGMSNAPVIAMAKYLSEHGGKMWIRHVLVPGITDSEEDLAALGAFVKTLKTVERFEILPYHTLALHKYEKLGIDYPLKGVREPSKEEVERAKRLTGI